MKTLASVMAVGAIGLFSLCDVCQPSAFSTVTQTESWPLTAAATTVEQRTLRLRIEGMTCGGCAIATRKALARLPGISQVEVSYEEKQATITYDPAQVTVELMVAAAQTLGYTATVLP